MTNYIWRSPTSLHGVKRTSGSPALGNSPNKTLIWRRPLIEYIYVSFISFWNLWIVKPIVLWYTPSSLVMELLKEQFVSNGYRWQSVWHSSPPGLAASWNVDDGVGFLLFVWYSMLQIYFLKTCFRLFKMENAWRSGGLYFFLCWCHAKDSPLFATAKYMICCANTFFRVCRASGIFLSGVERARALAHGMDMNDTWLDHMFLNNSWLKSWPGLLTWHIDI